MTGKLVVFEGLDGSGKTTVSQQLFDYLTGTDVPAMLTCEPCEQAAAGKWLRAALRKEFSTTPLAVAQAFGLNRLDHCHRFIAPALDQGKVVVCDRYLMSSYVYNVEGDVTEMQIDQFNQHDHILKPDLTFFLHASEATCLERMQARGKAGELYEAHLREHANRYLKRVDHARRWHGETVCVIDADAPLGYVVNAVIDRWEN